MDLRRKAAALLWELQQHGHEVIVVPAPRPRHHQHGIRVVITRNPEWYEALLRRHPLRSRPKQSVLKRCRVVKYLEAVAAGRPVHPATAQWLLTLLRETP